MFTWKKYVYEIYKEKSFSKAAQNLYISQPSLSARIKKVEQLLGAPIFDRSTSPLRLTEIGEEYIKSCEEIFQIEQNMENCINNLNTLKSGHLSMGGSNLLAAYVITPMITRFKQTYPDVTIQLTEGNTAQLEALLANNTLDFVIDNHRYDAALYSKEFYCNEDILLTVPKSFEINQSLTKYQLSYEDIREKNYRNPSHPAVPLHTFADTPFIMLTPGNDTRLRGEKLCKYAGFHPNIVLELNQQATAYMAASTQLGATFISDLLVSRLPSFESLVYYKLSHEEAKRELYFYYKKHKYITRAMKEFIAIMHE